MSGFVGHKEPTTPSATATQEEASRLVETKNNGGGLIEWKQEAGNKQAAATAATVVVAVPTAAAVPAAATVPAATTTVPAAVSAAHDLWVCAGGQL